MKVATLHEPMGRTLLPVIDVRQPVNLRHPLNRGLISRWQVIPQWRGGIVWRDLMRSNAPHEGTLTNMVPTTNWVSTSRLGGWGGLDLDGTDDYVAIFESQVVPVPYQSLGETLTLAAWVNTDDLGNETTNTNWIIEHSVIELRTETSSGTKVPFNFGFHNATIALGVSHDHDAGDERETGDTTVTTGEDLHIAVTVSGDDFAFYLNGAPDGSGTFATATADRSVGTTTSNMQIGARTRNNGAADANLYEGRVDDLRIFDRALSAPDVRRLYELSQQRFDPTLNWLRVPAVAAPAAAGLPLTMSLLGVGV